MKSKMQILVFGGKSDDSAQTQAARDMTKYVADSLASAGSDAEVYFCHIDEVTFVISNEGAGLTDVRNQRDFRSYDLVFFRGKLAAYINDAMLVAAFLKQAGVPFRNTIYGKRRAVGKIAQILQIQAIGGSVPTTIAAPNSLLPSLIAKHLGYPVIVKDVYASHGDCNFLVRDKQQLADILTQYPDRRLIAQQFIESEGDYRILLVGPETMIIHRQGQGDTHLNNVSQGAIASIIPLVEFPVDVINQARQIADDYDFELAGVDVIFDKKSGEHYFLEINSQPQLIDGAAFQSEKSLLLGKYLKSVLDSRLA